MKNWSEIDEKYAEGYDDGYRAGLQRARDMVDVPMLLGIADLLEFGPEIHGWTSADKLAKAIRKACGVVK